MTRLTKRAFSLGLVAGLAGCGGRFDGIETLNEKPELKAQVAELSSTLRVRDVVVNVPEQLEVTEANLYYPLGDINWREDPPGDRRAQVATIMDNAVTRGTAHLRGSTSVVMQIDMKRFHALSEKARYSIGGVHNLIFDITVKAARSGEVISGPHVIEIDLEAYGGEEALEAERRGITQKKRITARVISEMRKIFPAGQSFDVQSVDEMALGLDI